MTPDLIRYKSICKIYQEAYFYVVWILYWLFASKEKDF